MFKKSFMNAAIVAIAAGARIKSTLKTDWVFVDPYEKCEDIDNEHLDAHNDSCAWYGKGGHDWGEHFVEYLCGAYDTENFKAKEQCCGCGGGRNTGDKEPTPAMEL